MTTLASDSQAVDALPLKGFMLDTAILLPDSLSVIPDSSALSHPPVSPLTMVGGMPLFLRTLLTLQRAHITNIIVLGGSEEDSFRVLAKDARVHAVIRWMPAHGFFYDDLQTLGVLSHDESMCLVLGEPVVFSKALIEELRQQVHLAQGCILWPTSEYISQEPAADLAVVPRKFFKDESGRNLETSFSWKRIRLHACPGGRLKTIPLSSDSSGWVLPLRESQDVVRAEQRLLATPKGSMDGLVDTYFNRKAAAGLTRIFVKAGWSPNAVTVFSLLIGLAAAGSFAYGTYGSGIIGALFFQVSAIVDCCDGDVARLTFRESRFGEQLDLIGDNVVHMAIFGAIGWAGYLNGGGWLAVALGLLAMIGNLCSLWVVTRMKTAGKNSAVPLPVSPARRDFIVKNIANRDFSVVILLFALLNLLGVFLWFAAIGSNVFWMVAAWLTRPSIRA